MEFSLEALGIDETALAPAAAVARLAGAAGLATGMGLYWLAYLVTLAALAVLVVMQVVKAGSAMIGDRLTGHRPPHKDGEPEDRSDG